MIFELDPDLPLGGLVSDERILQERLGGRPVHVVLDQTGVNEVDEFFGPKDG